MKLFLCSSFVTDETRQAFEDLVDAKSNPLRIACITTAAQGYVELCKGRNEPYDSSWLDNDIVVARAYGYEVDQYELTAMKPSEFELFNTYDALWFEGGLTGYLISKIRQTSFEAKLNDLLKTKVYIGTSAGSMICSKSLDASEWYVGEPEEGVSKIPGLGYIDFQIYPHFQESNLAEIKKKRHTDQEYWLLKDGQAVCICDDDVQVLGGDITILEKIQ